MNPADEQEIRNILARYTGLWIEHEMAGWGRLFSANSDFITHRGVWWRSRSENVAGHQDIPAAVIAQKASYQQEIVSLRAITADVAIVHTEWSWPNHVPIDGTEPEDRRGLITLVLARGQGGWLIEAAHNTRLDGLETRSD
ncbi:YybH family protein [Actinoalloteichus hymeniacidonis]|uniref:DUF4440 domain-containing protein n=1 Tax=Actinoalloteichus hymeniacidonis TaxID=340345 RepID=A0AAC9MW60_9PSEU|nr:SgcJ/EcaC family oxidoreductase [Actinoalloteichus hymeniacidonis]AOS61843.1 hypothetical protein TL08_05075 [Actinoalloteichus hymeniacidonis]MBB5910137.1 uncharacterized protein (TIGR02246 family) [Actinoalloteichus hymeniacidonis]